MHHQKDMVADGRGGSGATGVSDGREEAVVGGREENDFIAGFRKGFDADRQGRHHGGGVEDPVSFDGPAATALEPGNHRIIIAFRYFRVTENPVFDPFAEGVYDTGSRAEIHIGHPHRDDLSGRDPGPVGRIPFDAGGSPALYDRSKIEAAIGKAIEAVEKRKDPDRAASLTDMVEEKLRIQLAGNRAHSIPAIEEIQDIVESVLIENKEVGAAGITEKTPGYFTLGKPWQYISGLNVDGATGGTDDGLSFTYRPDSMYVWIKRGGSSAATENYSVLFYSWTGTSKSSNYRSKDKKSCTNTGQHTNEESDIRQALDANDCGTTTKATQIAEGWVFEKKQYNDWTQIKVPIYYFNDEVPQMCNVIFSSTGYPNFRNQAGVVVGNSLCVDDVELIYSSKIEHLYIGGVEWSGFDPNSSEEQVYSVGHTTEVPEVYGTRGAGKITNLNGTTVNFPGRKLSSSEMTVSYGKVDGAATVITVKSGDGKSTRTYKIKMVQAASENAKLKSILVNGNPISNFNPQVGEYNVALPYGTTAAPNVTYVKAEDKQTVEVTQATSPTGKATIKVTAADGKTTKTYTLNFSVAALADNTLKGIKVNGEEIADFFPEQTSYRVELPLGTTQVPTVEAISAYPKGAQTITYTPPTAANLDNSIYLISVTTPGNQTAMIYRLQFKITASTNCRLKDLRLMVGGKNYIENFASDVKTYYVTLPMGTSAEPAIEYTKGDAYQTVDVQNGGVDGTSVITVTAANGDKMIYKIICKTEKSDVSHLNMIYVDGKALEGFDPTVKEYSYQLTPGTTALPAITWDKGSEPHPKWDVGSEFLSHLS